VQDETLQSEFTHQAEGFNRSAVAHAAETLDALVEFAAPSPAERWLDVACGRESSRERSRRAPGRSMAST